MNKRMTYDELDGMRKMSDEDAERAEEMISALEGVLEQNSFRGMPRSFRAAGLGYGCMEIFCHEGKYTVVRNNGAGLDQLPCFGSARECFTSLIKGLYGLRMAEDFADEQYEKYFGEQTEKASRE